jgi:SP family myo-inositol transporter-like MFS transporter 13
VLTLDTRKARILLRRGDKDAARAIMKKIYAFAKPEELDLKVGLYTFHYMINASLSRKSQLKVLQVTVRISVEITETTTFMHRFKSMVLDPVNRRALSEYCVTL